MSYSQQSSFSGYSQQQQPPPPSSAGYAHVHLAFNSLISAPSAQGTATTNLTDFTCGVREEDAGIAGDGTKSNVHTGPQYKVQQKPSSVSVIQCLSL